MLIVYNLEEGWKLAQQVMLDEDWIADVTDGHQFNPIMSIELDSFIMPVDGSECQVWIGGCNNNTGTRKPIPYFLPHSQRYPYMVPARQLLVARQLNVSYLSIRQRIRLSLSCPTPKCVAIAHIIPERMRARVAHAVHELVPTFEVDTTTNAELLEHAKKMDDIIAPRPTKPAHKSAILDQLLGDKEDEQKD